MKSASAVSVPSAVFVALGLLSMLPLISFHFVFFFQVSVSVFACPVIISSADFVNARRSLISSCSPFLFYPLLSCHSIGSAVALSCFVECIDQLLDVVICFTSIACSFVRLSSCSTCVHMSMEWGICCVTLIIACLSGARCSARMLIAVLAGQF